MLVLQCSTPEIKPSLSFILLSRYSLCNSTISMEAVYSWIDCCVHDCAILLSFSFQKLFCTQKAKNYRLAFLYIHFFPQSCEVETSVRSVRCQISLPISPLTPLTHVGEDFVDAKSELPMALPHWHISSHVLGQNISDILHSCSFCFVGPKQKGKHVHV